MKQCTHVEGVNHEVVRVTGLSGRLIGQITEDGQAVVIVNGRDIYLVKVVGRKCLCSIDSRLLV